ncbi:MAG: lysophospholipase [Thermocrispum sp.]
MSEHADGRFTGAAGLQIYWQSWLPGGEPVGVVVILHGYAEHSGRYQHVAAALNAAGYAVYALDHHGHGRSDGPRANVGGFAGLLTDVDRLVRLAAANHAGLPVFLLGHSMGGLVAVAYVLSDVRYDLAGLVVSAPAIEVAVGSPAEKVAARVLSRVVPNLPVTPFDSGPISRDPQVVAAYDADPLVYRGKIKIRTGAETLGTADRVQAALAKVDLPTLVMHGGDDRVVPLAGSQLLAEKAGSQDLTFTVYDGLYHEIFNEPEQQTVLADTVAWLEART